MGNPVTRRQTPPALATQTPMLQPTVNDAIKKPQENLEAKPEEQPNSLLAPETNRSPLHESVSLVKSRSDRAEMDPVQGLSFGVPNKLSSQAIGKILGVRRLKADKPNEELLSTPQTQARVRVDSTTGPEGFVCDHVFHTLNDMAADGEMQVGFIHTPQFPQEAQFSEVLGIGVKNMAEAAWAQEGSNGEATLMLTGFTQFGSVGDNVTGKFLTGDGTSTAIDSFGIHGAHNENVQNMMSNLGYGEPLAVEPFVQNGETVGMSYRFEQGTINLALVRLPVDYELSNTTDQDNNPQGDGAGDILRSAAAGIQPDGIISTGVGIYRSENPQQDIYEIETFSNGLETSMSGPDYDRTTRNNPLLGDMFTRTLKQD